MSDTPEPATEPEVPAPPPTPPARKKHHRVATIILSIVLIPAVAIALWIWVAMGYTYASGDRAGYVQKISKKGWLCKTWEGELAMANLPGTMPQIFSFTVRNDSVANVLEQTIGKQVSVTYEQHRGLPTSCFGETEYFISRVNRIGP
jgi:hypothetical protein